jgi:hypothetical protein
LVNFILAPARRPADAFGRPWATRDAARLQEGPLRFRTIPLGDGGRDIALHVEDGHYD